MARTFQDIVTSIESILKRNPAKALQIDSNAAVALVNGTLQAMTIGSDGMICRGTECEVKALSVIGTTDDALLNPQLIALRPITRTPYTLTEIREEYTALLKANPGKAIVLGEIDVVVLSEDKTYCYVAMIEDGKINLDNGSDMENFYDGHWDGETREETEARINSPKLLDIATNQ